MRMKTFVSPLIFRYLFYGFHRSYPVDHEALLDFRSLTATVSEQ